MKWNWQRKDWPEFRYDVRKLRPLEDAYLLNSGTLLGAFKHVHEDEKQSLIIEIISDEALKTSEIEGEYLDRDSIQSSIRRHFGLAVDKRRVGPSERGIAEMMTDLYQKFDEQLEHATLYHWHTLLATGRRDLADIGRYRTHDDPMQVVSGPIHKPTVHFEAPPSPQIKKEMNRFMTWFRETAPDGKTPLPPLTRAGIAHLYFVCIHPFEDGNGRIGRAIAEKALAECIGQPTLIALSRTIEANKKQYYAMLERSNKSNEVTSWLEYFAQTILEAQAYSTKLVEFLIKKTRFYDTFRGQLNPRQEKALARIFREGPEGFKGGLSVANYIAITEAPRATATRDLQDLVEKGIFVKTGELKSTRYYLDGAQWRSS